MSYHVHVWSVADLHAYPWTDGQQCLSIVTSMFVCLNVSLKVHVKERDVIALILVPARPRSITRWAHTPNQLHFGSVTSGI